MEWLIWNPILINFHESLAAFKHLFVIEGWNTKLHMRVIHPLKVFICAEHDDLIIDSPVCFSSFKTLNGIMNRSIGWVNIEWLVWNDFRFLPATISFVVVNLQHVICCHTSKSICVIRARFL